VSTPLSAAKADDAVSPASPPTLSGVLSLIFLYLHTKNFYRLQVSRTASPTAPRFFPSCMPHLTLTPLAPTQLGVDRFSSLMKQNKKGKNCAVFCFAGKRKLL
jgi:hypothetical protein